MYYIWDFI